MCLHKRFIRNKVASYKRGEFDKFLIQVQCNNCPECRKQHQNDWLVRSYFEITRHDYPSIFFVTLDFKDEFLPRYNGYPCFDSELIKSFFKRLRYYTGSFRYLYSTDYGAALQRPHYHVMFLFERDVNQYQFFNYIKTCWIYGDHQRIDRLRSGSSVWDCVRYVCKYTVKDITFSCDGKEKSFPSRYRSRTQASSHYGYSALEEGFITWDMLKNDLPVYLPVGKNGKSLPYRIPRYYEIKITQYSVYYPEFRRSEFFKNDLGFELQKIRHNSHYLYLFDCLVSSTFDNIHRLDCYKVWQSIYPDSPYNGLMWSEILADVLGDGEEFLDFLSIQDFLVRKKNFTLRSAYGKYIDSRYIDDWIDHLIDNPRYELYNQVLHLFNLYRQELDYSNFLVETYSSIQEAHKRLLHKIENNQKLRLYLNRLNFDYSKLFDIDVLKFLDDFKSYVNRVDTPILRVVKDSFSVRKFSEFRLRKYLKIS